MHLHQMSTSHLKKGKGTKDRKALNAKNKDGEIKPNEKTGRRWCYKYNTNIYTRPCIPLCGVTLNAQFTPTVPAR